MSYSRESIYSITDFVFHTLVKILTQQTPKPMAQLPMAVSPRSAQACANRHTPKQGIYIHVDLNR